MKTRVGEIEGERKRGSAVARKIDADAKAGGKVRDERDEVSVGAEEAVEEEDGKAWACL
jgi:hypothetical protein